MGLSLPPVPSGPTEATVIATLNPARPDITINLPFPDLIRDMAVFAQELAGVVAALRSGVLSLESEVTAVDTSGLATKDELTLLGQQKVTVQTYNAKVSALELADAAAYKKAPSGIPEGDLAQAVRDKLAGLNSGSGTTPTVVDGGGATSTSTSTIDGGGAAA